ncbi:MAG: alpha/beta hydrolase [Pseudomonadota bacterium]
MRKTLWAVAIVLAAIAALGAVLHTPDSDPERMIADYGDGGQYVEGAETMRVFVREQGCATCPALVLIHGSNSNSLTWAPLIDHLKDNWRIISYDQPGHGLTGPHPDRNYTARGMHQALTAAMDAKSLDQAVLVGSSMGGWTSWTYAALNPERVRGLVLIGASGMPASPDAPERPTSFVYSLLETPGFNQILKYVTPVSFVENALRAMVVDDGYVTEDHVRMYWRMLRMPGNRQATLDRREVVRDESLREDLRSFDGPVQLIWGREDPTVHVSVAAAFAEHLPQAETVIYDAVGHLPMEERPAEVAADMRRFLEGAGLDR